MRIKKRCCLCGAEYYTGNGKAKYCSNECRKEATRQRQKAWREEHPEYHKDYFKDHPEARERFVERHPNYDRDRSRGLRGSQECTKQCIVCGKTFVTWNPNKKTCSDTCKEIHKKTYNSGRKRTKTKKRTTEEEHERWVKRRYGSEENYQKWLAEQETLKQERLIQREAEKEAKKRTGFCIVCGKEFKTLNPSQKTCSKKCGKKYEYARKDKRIPKSQIVDKDITLEALYRRDSGVCYLCGGVCDWNDKQGNIVGALYPSIDHVTPVAKGGLHSWQNVRLAHFACNVAKSDAINPDFDGIVPENAYQYARKVNERRKKVEQWTENGEFVAVYESTAEAERKTGIKCKGIQKCARRETKSYHNYVWKYA